MVGAEVKDGTILVKRFLCSIPMVVVPVHNQDAPHTVLSLDITGRDGHIVENAEAHPAGGSGVMSWRPYGSEGILDLTLHHGINRVKDATGREFSRL
jgi:hypothetical protein